MYESQARMKTYKGSLQDYYSVIIVESLSKHAQLRTQR